MAARFVKFLLLLLSFPLVAPAQKIISAKSFGGNNIDDVLNLRIDSAGNKFIRGNLSANSNITTDSLYSIDGADVYFFKLNQTNSLKWAVHFGEGGSSFGWEQ